MPNLKKTANNYAFIDGQNLNLGVRLDVANYKGKSIYNGHKLDYKKFRNYLRNKYNVKQAYLFIGFIASNNKLYTYLQSVGYTLVFKTVASYIDVNEKEINKGNVDTDLVLYSAAILYKDYDQAVFVSGDGDFLSLYDYISQNNKLLRILVPNRHRYSKLLNNYRNKLGFVSDIKPLLNPIKKTRSDGRLKTLGLPGHGDTI